MYLFRRETTSQGVLATAPNHEKSVTLYIFNRRISYSRRAGGPGTMGRFGGGWNVKFGFQAGSLRGLLCLDGVIVELFVCSIRFGIQDEHNNEAAARAFKQPPPKTAEQAKGEAIALTEALVEHAKKSPPTS